MADKKISALTDGVTPQDTDESPWARAAANVKLTWLEMRTALASIFVPQTTTVNGHALSANVTVSASDVGLGSVTNDAQTKAAIVPNTAPSAGQILAGNAGGSAYAPVSVSGDATVASTGALTLATVNSNVGSFTNASITVDAKGRITAASTGSSGSVAWGSITGTLSSQTDLNTALAGKVPTTTTVNGHALNANVTVSASDVGLGSVTNDAQTKAAIVPNTVPSAGQMFVGNVGGTAFTVVSLSGDATVDSSGVVRVTKTNNSPFATSATVDTTNASNISSGTLATARGGTGVNGSSAANGTLLIGNGTGYTLTTLTAGANISITNTSGAITIAATGSGGGASLDAVTAATASATINSGNNPIRWNWAQTTASQTAFTYSENTASTGGSGSQVLLKVGTIASSTADPLQVQCRGTDVIRISRVGAVTIAALNGTSGGGSTGNAVSITGGTGATDSAGGAITIQGGQGGSGATGGNGGAVTVQAGTGVSLTGGALVLSGGVGSSAASGSATLKTQDTAVSNASGSITISTGNCTLGPANGTTGDINLTTGTTNGTRGTLNITGCDVANGTVATTLTSVGPTGANTTVQGWLAIKIAGTLRYIPYW